MPKRREHRAKIVANSLWTPGPRELEALPGDLQPPLGVPSRLLLVERLRPQLSRRDSVEREELVVRSDPVGHDYQGRKEHQARLADSGSLAAREHLRSADQIGGTDQELRARSLPGPSSHEVWTIAEPVQLHSVRRHSMMTANDGGQLAGGRPRETAHRDQPPLDREVSHQLVAGSAAVRVVADRRTRSQPSFAHPVGEALILHGERWARLAHVVDSGQPTRQAANPHYPVRHIAADPIEHLSRQPLVHQTTGDGHGVVEVLVQRQPMRDDLALGVAPGLGPHGLRC